MSVIILQPSGKITTKSTLAAAAAAADVAGKTVIVSSPITLSADLTWPTDRALNIAKGGVITVSTGVTLTINGPFIAGMYQIFAGAGSVVFGTNAVKYQYPGWWAGYSTEFKAWNSENDGASSGLDADLLHGYAPSLTAGANKIPVTDDDEFINVTGLAANSVHTPALKFPATQTSSSDVNTLDDYEEGTWTPTLVPDTGSITLQIAQGYYTKIGNLVHLSLYALVLGVSSPTGDLRIKNIPAFGTLLTNSLPAVSIYADTLTSSASAFLQGQVQYNSGLEIFINRYSAGSTYQMAAYVKANTILRVSATFPVVN